jgi:putative flippase GtrA
MLPQFVRYVVIGGLSTAIHYVVLYTLHERLSLDGVFSTTIGMLISAVFNFFANYHFTFRSSAGMFESLWRFVVIIGLGVLINAGIFWLLVTRLSWFYLFGQAIATIAVLFWNFLFSRTFIYVSRMPALKVER